MIKRLLLTLLFFVFVDAHAQQTLWGDKPIVSPEIHEKNTVTFRLKSPNAQKGEITGDCRLTQKMETSMREFDVPRVAALVKNDKGVGEYTTVAPLPSELYGYSFIVDGLRINDPANV